MAEELNGRLPSPLHNSSTDQLHQSLRLLVRKIRAQLEVLTKKNKLLEDENIILNTEISSLKQQVSNLNSTINTKTDEITEITVKLESESQRHSTIESQLLAEMSSLRTEQAQLITDHQNQTETLIKEHQHTLNTEKQNFENLRQQKLSSDHKLQEIMQSNDVLHSKLKELQQETQMESLKTENINYLSKIQQLKKEINDKDQKINDIGLSLVSMQNDIQCLETKSKSKNIIVNEYESKAKQCEEELIHFQAQYKELKEALDTVIDTAKHMNNDSFWSVNDDDIVLETTAHPFNVDDEHNKRLKQIQLLPKRVRELQEELLESQSMLKKEKDTISQVTTYWKNKIKELNTKNTDLSLRMEDLERMVDRLSSHNDRLIKENDGLKAEMHNNKFTSSAHEIYLQMKTKEETEKTIELQQELDVLHDDLLRKSALIAKIEKSERMTKQSMIEQKKLHQTEMAQLTNKLNVLTQLSQEEIQQTFHLTIQELQSILDQNITQNDEGDIKENKDIETEHLLSPKLKVPHITDSDVGDNDDDDIIEAEDKLASYFARHKQRQIVITREHDKNQSKPSSSVEPIQEVNEENELNDQSQIVEIVDDEDIDGEENILTPPLQEEAPYFVDDDTLSIDRAIGNVPVSNVADSNCSTRGNSTRGDQSPNSIKIDEPPTKDDDDADEDIQETEKKSDGNEAETPDIIEDKTIESKNEDVEREEKTADDEAQILHSLQPYLSTSTTNTTSSPQQLQPLQPLQQRTRSMGSVATTIDDLQSVDQSMLAHDGSRDGSVVPEAQLCLLYRDEADEEITADTNSNVPPLPNPSEYVATPDITATEINSIDDIHEEAHQIIDDVHENLKELQSSNKPTIVQENEAIDNQITNDDILSPLIERQHNHRHDIEKQKKLLNTAKQKWNRKMEEMIAHTDSWFINEDGDIVLIYPEADINEDTINDVNDEDTPNVNDNNVRNEEHNAEEEEKEEVEDEGNVCYEKEDDMIMNDNDNDIHVKESNLNDLDKGNDENVKKTENFFNSFRIF